MALKLRTALGTVETLSYTYFGVLRQSPSLSKLSRYWLAGLRKFKTIHLNFKDDARPRLMWFYDRALRLELREPRFL